MLLAREVGASKLCVHSVVHVPREPARPSAVSHCRRSRSGKGECLVRNAGIELHALPPTLRYSLDGREALAENTLRPEQVGGLCWCVVEPSRAPPTICQQPRMHSEPVHEEETETAKRRCLVSAPSLGSGHSNQDRGDCSRPVP